MPSYGYDGPIAANEWALMQQVIGIDYSAATKDACRVTANTSGVQVAAGQIGGWGVLDVVTASQQVNLSAPGSGASWWMIVARRNWTTKATTFVAIAAGTSRPSILPTRLTAPGTQDDQPLALVGWTAGQSQPGSVVDLRVIGIAGQQLAFDTQALQYLTIPGRQVRVGTANWICGVNSTTGTIEWLSGTTGDGARVTFSTTSPAGSGWYLLLASGTRAAFHWRSTDNVAANTAATPNFTLPAGYRPSGRTALAAAGGALTPRTAACVLDSTGVWQVYNGHSSATVITVDGTYDLA